MTPASRSLPCSPLANACADVLVRIACPLARVLAFLVPLQAGFVLGDPFQELVRPTEALTPQEEAAGFSVPDGFTVGLFAAEPMVNKPINIAFDSRGRLWVSSNTEYPYPAAKERWADDQGSSVHGSRDAIKILEDTDGDGQADRVTDFADGLNVPIGVLPYGNGCIAWSIPNIWHLEDTDGDGRCDRRTILFGPLGYERDTHGNIASLRMGLDGWVYATHGFNNVSRFEVRPERLAGRRLGDPGTVLEVQSGNVFRFRPDGSAVEIWSWGQVNPFGLAWDAWGNLYSADCHSNPITQLIRGAHYPSFGKPHDGLGFGPVMCPHSHGSTGLCGLVYLDGGVWGPDWDNHMLLGNVVTSRINRDHVVFTGSTPHANESPDFLVPADPWFRPVDLRLGPDGALYVADFYNRIIGHYEVALDHPGRDRERGRIWRIAKNDATGSLRDADFTALDEASLVEEFGSANATRREFAMGEAIRRLDAARGASRSSLVDLIEAVLRDSATASPSRFVSAAAVLLRTGRGDALGTADLDRLPLQAKAALIPLAAEFPAWESDAVRQLVASAQRSDDPRLLRAAAAAISGRPAPTGDRIPTLVAALGATAPEDETLRHTLRIAIREQLRSPEGFDVLAGIAIDPSLEPEIARIATSLKTSGAAAWLLERIIASSPDPDERLVEQLAGIARLLPSSEEPRLASFVRERFAGDLEVQASLLDAIHNGLAQRGDPPSPATREWAQVVATGLAEAIGSQPEPAWTRAPVPNAAESRSPWGIDRRPCQDEMQTDVLSSLPPPRSAEIEVLTGMLRSSAFACPERLTFWLCGHRGFPDQPPHDRNLVRLVAADSGDELARALPPRSDTAQRIEWDLHPHRGRLVRIELIDGDSANAYAWLAAGRFDPPVVSVRLTDPESRVVRLATLVQAFELDRFTGDLAALLVRDDLSDSARGTVARALTATGAGAEMLGNVLKSAPSRLQLLLAEEMASTPEGVARLCEAAPPRLLAAPSVAGKIEALGDPVLVQRVAELTRDLPPANAQADALIAERLASFMAALTAGTADAGKGAGVFTVHCAACHQIGGQGGLVGPQLDGIGQRGAERLCEDILDPNRAVDPMFYMRILKMKDDSVVSGLLRREEGATLVIADPTGREFSVPKSNVAETTETRVSLMPPVFGLSIPPEDLHHLLAYLLETR